MGLARQYRGLFGKNAHFIAACEESGFIARVARHTFSDPRRGVSRKREQPASRIGYALAEDRPERIGECPFDEPGQSMREFLQRSGKRGIAVDGDELAPTSRIGQ